MGCDRFTFGTDCLTDTNQSPARPDFAVQANSRQEWEFWKVKSGAQLRLYVSYYKSAALTFWDGA
jgi:hypothetical protein